MGFFDIDGASAVSRRSSRHTSSKHHTSSHRDRDEKPKIRGIEIKKHRSRSRSRDRDRDRDHDRSRSRSRNRAINVSARSFFGLDNGSRNSHHHHHSSSGGNRKHAANASFFSLPNLSSRSIFSSFSRATGYGGGAGGSSSYYRRSPRSSFLQRSYKKLKRLLRDLVYYAKKHPLKVFMLAIMPLITGGALTALLARFGLRMPKSIERMMGMGARAMSGDSVGLVGEAVRMAAVAGTGAGVGGAARGLNTSLERGRSGNLQWERRSVERDYFGGGGGGTHLGYGSRSESGSGWGGSLAGIRNFFS